MRSNLTPMDLNHLRIKPVAQKEVSVKIGPGFTGLLTILFIGLKLTGYISWSWWWVLSPLWLPIVIVLGIFAVFFVIALIVAVITALIKR